MLNTSQQIGGSLGTALLNTLFAGAVTAYFTDNPPTSPEQAKQILPLAFIHGYHVAFFWGAVLFAAALLVSFAVHQRAQGGHPRRRRRGCRLCGVNDAFGHPPPRVPFGPYCRWALPQQSDPRQPPRPARPITVQRPRAEQSRPPERR